MIDKKPFKAYDAEGNVHPYKTAIDQHDAVSMCEGYSLTKPGETAPAQADPMRNYDAMSVENLRKACVARNIKGYKTMNTETQVEALQVQDARMAQLDSNEVAAKPPEPVVDAPSEPTEKASTESVSAAAPQESASERKNRLARERRADASKAKAEVS